MSRLARKPAWYEGAEDWQEQAACLDKPLSWFFTSEDRNEDERSLPGLKVCPACPVRRECLEYALTFELLDGIWGGVTSQQRRRIVLGGSFT